KGCRKWKKPRWKGSRDLARGAAGSGIILSVQLYEARASDCGSSQRSTERRQGQRPPSPGSACERILRARSRLLALDPKAFRCGFGDAQGPGPHAVDVRVERAQGGAPSNGTCNGPGCRKRAYSGASNDRPGGNPDLHQESARGSPGRG